MPIPLYSLVLREGNRDYHSDFPLELIAGTGDDPRPRLRVDPGQTSFFEGREFRTFHEFNIAAGNSEWIRFTTVEDVIIHARDITVVEGKLRFALGTGGTPSGVWTPKTVFPVNAMADRPSFSGTVLSDTGGSVVGMVERDLTLIETPNASGQAVSINLGVEEVGLPANVYYTEFRNTGSGVLRGLYRVHWEERKPRSPNIYG